jgi:tetratricopeptide (TPR) repeat protein
MSEAAAQKKVALVIGNDAYARGSRLDTPARDAQAVCDALQKLGFKLVGDRPFINLGRAATTRMLEEFRRAAQNAEIALFYFSGHGMQLRGKNYLVPVDLRSFSPATLDSRAVNADVVLAAMEKSNARARIMLLDASRSNPFMAGTDQRRGLTRMKAPRGTAIGFAAQPDTTVSRGAAGDLSPYAKALAAYISVKGLDLRYMLAEAGLDVMRATNDRQRPWFVSSISERVTLAPPSEDAPAIVGSTRFDFDRRSVDSSAASPWRGDQSPFIDQPTPPPVFDPALVTWLQDAHKQLTNKDYPGAIATLTKAIDRDQEFAVAYSYRGFARYLEGQTKQPQQALLAYGVGVSDFDKAIELEPSYAPVRRHRGNTILAQYKALQALGLPVNDTLDRAIRDLKDAVDLDPTSKLNRNVLGEAYLTMGAYELAIESFNQAIRRDSTYADPYAGLCVAYRMLGNWDEARKNAQLAAERDGDLRSKPCLTRPMYGRSPSQDSTTRRF